MGSTSSGKSSTVTMDVDFSNVKPLTNFEVYSFMKKSTESKDRLRCQQTLFFTGLKYFNEKSPCICQAAEDIQKFLTDMKPFNLNKSELLALINNCPATHVELSVVSRGFLCIFRAVMIITLLI